MIEKPIQFAGYVFNQFIKNEFGLDENSVLANNIVDQNGTIPPENQNKKQINSSITAEYMSIDSEYRLHLFEKSNSKLSEPMRINQHNYNKQPYLFRKSRKRIETLFSQLCDQFMIRKNYAKSLAGFKARILYKITALTVIQYLNYFVFNRNINLAYMYSGLINLKLTLSNAP